MPFSGASCTNHSDIPGRHFSHVVPKGEIVKLLLVPSSRGGVDATSKNIAEGILDWERTGWSEVFLTTPYALLRLLRSIFLMRSHPSSGRRGLEAKINAARCSQRRSHRSGSEPVCHARNIAV